MEDKPHPITLHQVFFTRTVVIAIPTHVQDLGGEKIPIGPANNISFAEIEGEPNFYQVTMRSQMNEGANPAYPYVIDMECFGIFHADPSLSADEAKRGVMITAHGVLYGAIREAVSWITGRQPFGPLIFGLSIISPPPKPKTE